MNAGVSLSCHNTSSPVETFLSLKLEGRVESFWSSRSCVSQFPWSRTVCPAAHCSVLRLPNLVSPPTQDRRQCSTRFLYFFKCSSRAPLPRRWATSWKSTRRRTQQVQNWRCNTHRPALETGNQARGRAEEAACGVPRGVPLHTTRPPKTRAGEASAGSPTVSPTRRALCGFFTGLGCGVSWNEAATRSSLYHPPPSPEHGFFLWQLWWRRGAGGFERRLAARFPPH